MAITQTNKSLLPSWSSVALVKMATHNAGGMGRCLEVVTEERILKQPLVSCSSECLVTE